MKIALVHEFLNQLGGAERVLQNFLEIWPDATLHVLLYNSEKTHGLFEKYTKKISFLNQFPLAKKHPKLLWIFMPWAIGSFKFKEFDLVLSDASAFAKGVKTPGKLHICYCHTPTRFLWSDQSNYLSNVDYPFFLKWAGFLVMPFMQKWDYQAGQRPHALIANSENVKNRIKKYYNRESVSIFPPIDTEFFHPVGTKKDYFFTVSRLEPYKKTKLVIQAFNELGLPLKIAGTGSELAELKKIAKPNIEFLGRVSDEQLRTHYSEAKAFIFPAEEDAGMTVVESMSCGTPVVAYRAGGVLETVREGVSGEFFDVQTAASLVEVMKKFNLSNYSPAKIREHALQFDKKIFQQKIKQFIEEKYKEFYAHRN